MNNFTTKVALTTDIWSSSYNNTAFLGITMHYINSEWKLKKCILDFIPIEESRCFIPALTAKFIICAAHLL